MSDLIHKIVGVIIEAGQSDTTKFKLGETIRYSPSEILEILKQHENEIFGEEPSTQPNTSNTLNALDCISRVQALNNIKSLYPEAPRINFMDNLAQWKKKYSQYMECERVIENLPSAQPEITQKDVELYCRRRCLTLITNEFFNEIKARWSAQPKQSTEVQDILQFLDERLHPIVSPEHWNVYSELHDMISRLLSAEPERKTGKWIEIDDDLISGRCSQCGWEAHLYEDDVVGMDYCPNCGAKMEESNGSNT